jgi:hypothetical protein
MRFVENAQIKYPFIDISKLTPPHLRSLNDKLPPTPATASIPLRKKTYLNPALNPTPAVAQPFIFPFSNKVEVPKSLEEAFESFNQSVYETLWTRDCLEILSKRNKEKKGLMPPEKIGDRASKDFGQYNLVEIFYVG